VEAQKQPEQHQVHFCTLSSCIRGPFDNKEAKKTRHSERHGKQFDQHML
jgi:hypothetical protein